MQSLAPEIGEGISKQIYHFLRYASPLSLCVIPQQVLTTLEIVSILRVSCHFPFLAGETCSRKSKVGCLDYSSNMKYYNSHL